MLAFIKSVKLRHIQGNFQRNSKRLNYAPFNWIFLIPRDPEFQYFVKIANSSIIYSRKISKKSKCLNYLPTVPLTWIVLLSDYDLAMYFVLFWKSLQKLRLLWRMNTYEMLYYYLKECVIRLITRWAFALRVLMVQLLWPLKSLDR